MKNRMEYINNLSEKYFTEIIYTSWDIVWLMISPYTSWIYCVYYSFVVSNIKDKKQYTYTWWLKCKDSKGLVNIYV